MNFTLPTNGFSPPKKELKTVPLTLDTASSLKWEKEKIPEGFSLLWDFKMGLFDQLPMPLSDDAQLLTLQTGLSYFREKFFPEFAEATYGIILYTGKVPELSELEYLIDLLPEMPETHIFLSFPSYTHLELFRFLSYEGSEHFHYILEGQFPYGSHKKALLLPSQNAWTPFVSPQVPYKVIPEHLLTQEWEGIDELYVPQNGVSAQGRRKISGFIAAGGTIVNY